MSLASIIFWNLIRFDDSFDDVLSARVVPAPPRIVARPPPDSDSASDESYETTVTGSLGARSVQVNAGEEALDIDEEALDADEEASDEEIVQDDGNDGLEMLVNPWYRDKNWCRGCMTWELESVRNLYPSLYGYCPRCWLWWQVWSHNFRQRQQLQRDSWPLLTASENARLMVPPITPWDYMGIARGIVRIAQQRSRGPVAPLDLATSF